LLREGKIIFHLKYSFLPHLYPATQGGCPISPPPFTVLCTRSASVRSSYR